MRIVILSILLSCQLPQGFIECCEDMDATDDPKTAIAPQSFNPISSSVNAANGQVAQAPGSTVMLIETSDATVWVTQPSLPFEGSQGVRFKPKTDKMDLKIAWQTLPPTSDPLSQDAMLPDSATVPPGVSLGAGSIRDAVTTGSDALRFEALQGRILELQQAFEKRTEVLEARLVALQQQLDMLRPQTLPQVSLPASSPPSSMQSTTEDVLSEWQAKQTNEDLSFQDAGLTDLSPQMSGVSGEPLEVSAVHDEFNVLVLSGKGLAKMQDGMMLLLNDHSEPLAAAQVTKLIPVELAIAQITHRLNPSKPLREGNHLFARPLLKPSSD